MQVCSRPKITCDNSYDWLWHYVVLHTHNSNSHMADIMAGIFNWDDFKGSQEAQSFEALCNTGNTTGLDLYTVSQGGKQKPTRSQRWLMGAKCIR